MYARGCAIVLEVLKNTPAATDVRPLDLIPFLESHGWLRSTAVEILMESRRLIMAR